MPPKTKTGEIAVRRCRYNRKSIRCEWEAAGDTYAVTFHDNPLPSFEKALSALGPHVCALCELPSKDADKIEPTGVTVLPLGDDNEKALIVAKKKIRKGKRVFNISTPLLAMYPSKDDEKKGSDCMEEDEARAIAKFVGEVKKYIAGDRAQGKLAFEDEAGEDDKDDKDEKQVEFPETETAKS